jgi:hypothetical protein
MMSYNNDEEYFVYSRPMPKKIGHLYMNVPWSDVALQNVPKSTPRDLEIKDLGLFIDTYINGNTIREDGYNDTYINDTYINDTSINDTKCEISINETFIKEQKGEGKFIRARKIPQKKQKNYPTKVKNACQVDKYISRFDKYNEINYYGIMA